MVKTLFEAIGVGIAWTLAALVLLWYFEKAESAGDALIAVFSVSSGAHVISRRTGRGFGLALLVAVAGSVSIWLIGSYFGVIPVSSGPARWQHPDFVIWLVVPPWVVSGVAAFVCRPQMHESAQSL